jgi:excisionase family DNA binding protein
LPTGARGSRLWAFTRPGRGEKTTGVEDAQDTAQDKVTIQEAARRLGVKEGAIRKRIQRGSLKHEKTEEGRVFVWVDTAQDATQDTTEDAYRETAQDALLSAKDETIAALREQLAQAHERDRENRRIIAALTSRIPAIEAPADDGAPDARGTPKRGEEQQGRGDAPTETQGATSRPPLWRRIFGGGT